MRAFHKGMIRFRNDIYLAYSVYWTSLNVWKHTLYQRLPLFIQSNMSAPSSSSLPPSPTKVASSFSSPAFSLPNKFGGKRDFDCSWRGGEYHVGRIQLDLLCPLIAGPSL